MLDELFTMHTVLVYNKMFKIIILIEIHQNIFKEYYIFYKKCS